MRLGTTIAAVVLAGSLTASTADDTSLTTSPPSAMPPAIGPPSAAAEPMMQAAMNEPESKRPSRTAAPARGERPSRTAAAASTRGGGSTSTWSMNLSAGEAAGVTMVAGTARLDPKGVFLAPLENGVDTEIADTGSTGADRGRRPDTATSDNPAATGGALTEADTAADTPVPTGLLTLPAQRLGSATLQVDSVVVGVVPAGSTATVDVRGRDADGIWSEWIPAAGVAGSTFTLPRPATTVQSRLVLTGPPVQIGAGSRPGPAVQGITLTVHPLWPVVPPGSAPTSPSTTTPSTTSPTSTPSTTPPTSTTRTTAPDRANTTSPSTTTTPRTTTPSTTTPRTTTPSTTTPTTTTTVKPTTTTPATAGSALRSRVFATRIGLVGRTTANGHKIKSSDRFVALPSRRALSANGGNDYSVKVCASNGRCAIAPVWDVGPWNTRDDYWNPSSRRQEWRDLAQGMPEAQAAKEKGYNGGRDQFNRKVANPAGIDLSDGLFWDALGLKDNGWVTVDYLWTGKTRVSTVKAEAQIHEEPSAGATVVGVAARQSSVPVECVTGSGADRWVRIGPDQYLPGKAVNDPGSARSCSTATVAG